MQEVTRETFADRGSERMVLSCALRDPDRLIDISAKLREVDVLSSNHRALYSVLKSLYEQGVKSFDLMAVVNEAAEKDVLPLIGGADYVDALLSNPVNSDNLEVYVSKVLDCSSKYRLFKETEHIQEAILSNLGSSDLTLPAEELIANAETRLLDVSMEARQVEDAINIGDGLVDRLREMAENPVEVLGISTNIPLLDRAINGLLPGSLSILAARQKGGKSTLMTNMAAYIAYDLGIPVLYIDTEMSRAEVQTRIVSHVGRVPERFVTNGKFIENRLYTENVWRACDIVNSGELYHKYMPGFTMDAVKSMVRKFRAREKIGVFFFDYIKMPEVTGASAFKEHQLLGNVATGLKDLAGQLDIPVVAAAQIKRGETANPKTRFHDTDVADSDRIGRYCTSLWALAPKSRKEVEEDGLTCGTHRLQVLLARGGMSNFHGIDLHCDFPTLTISQAEHQSSGMAAFQEREN